MSPTTPSTLPGGYRLLALLGQGGMGAVYRAWDPRLERQVAIKIPHAGDAQAAARLEREARAVARLQHPSIVTLHDIGRDASGLPFLVMELLEGQDLAHHLQEHGPLAPEEAVHLLLPVLDALAAAHDQGLVHRDIKPDNLFRVRGPRGEAVLKLLDFGVARWTARASDLTLGIVGTPELMAPEQLHEGAEIGPATDQWAICVTLYTLVTGEHPFAGDGLGEIFHRIATAPLPYPRAAGTDGRVMDGRLFAVLARGTRKSPSDRYASVRELAAELERWRATASERRRAEPETPPRPAAAIVTEPPRVERPSTPLDTAIRRSLGGRA